MEGFKSLLFSRSAAGRGRSKETRGGYPTERGEKNVNGNRRDSLKPIQVDRDEAVAQDEKECQTPKAANSKGRQGAESCGAETKQEILRHEAQERLAARRRIAEEKPPKVRRYAILFGDEEWTYIGSWRKGVPHGHGVATSPYGEQYSGEWNEGIRQGKGRYLWPDGNFYDGDWHDGDFFGFGRYEWSSGDWYEGEWINGIRHGRGVFHWANGDEYSGDWVNGIRHGKGVIRWGNGAIYDGDWKSGVPSGFGRKRWSNGAEYVGMWEGGKMHDYGVKKHDGTVYEGGWKHGKQEGYGAKTWPDGTKYEGMWRSGLHDGHGIKQFENGSKYDGEWLGGKPHKRGLLFWADGRCYDIVFKHGSYDKLNKSYSSQSSFANECLVDTIKCCECLKRSLKLRLGITKSMFSDDDYSFASRRPPKNALFIGRENLRGMNGAPPVDGVPNFRTCN